MNIYNRIDSVKSIVIKNDTFNIIDTVIDVHTDYEAFKTGNWDCLQSFSIFFGLKYKY